MEVGNPSIGISDDTRPTRTESSSSSTKNNRSGMLSNTNTDKDCLPENSGFIATALYRYNLWKGLYMLNPNERIFFHIFGWMFLASLFLYVTAFLQGLWDGFWGIPNAADLP